MRNKTSDRRLEASTSVCLTRDVEEQRWIVASVNHDGWPLDYAVEPELVDEDGNATEADLDAARDSYVFASDLHGLLAGALGL